MRHLIGQDAIQALRERQRMLDQIQGKSEPDLVLTVLWMVLGMILTVCLMLW